MTYISVYNTDERVYTDERVTGVHITRHTYVF